VRDDGAPAPLTVRDVVELPAMAGATVLGGKAGLDRPVTGVNVIEVPDVARWLRGGEFLFTAGYAWRERPDHLADLLPELDRAGVAGVAVKLGTYLARLGPSVCAVADELRLPVVQLPAQVAYMDVIDPLYRRLVSQRLWLLERSAETQQLLARAGLEEQSVDRVLAAAAAQVGNPVVMVDAVDEALVTASPDGLIERCPLDDLDPEQQDTAAHLQGLTLRRGTLELELAGRPALAAGLVVGPRSRGAVAVLGTDRPLDEFCELAVAHTAELLSFLLLKRIAGLEGRRHAADLFLASLLTDFLTTEEAAERALALGLRLTRPSAVLALALPAKSDPQTARAAVEAELGGVAHAVGPDEDHLVVVAQPVDPDRDTRHQLATRLAAALETAGVTPVAVGTAVTGAGLESLRRGRTDAVLALRSSGSPSAAVVHFEDMGVERLLSQLPLGPEASAYVEATIGPVVGDAEMLRTLEAYCAAGGRKAAASAALRLHRSTLDYRLAKITALLGTDLAHPERVLELWLATRLRRLLGTRGPQR